MSGPADYFIGAYDGLQQDARANYQTFQNELPASDTEKFMAELLMGNKPVEQLVQERLASKGGGAQAPQQPQQSLGAMGAAAAGQAAVPMGAGGGGLAAMGVGGMGAMARAPMAPPAGAGAQAPLVQAAPQSAGEAVPSQSLGAMAFSPAPQMLTQTTMQVPAHSSTTTIMPQQRPSQYGGPHPDFPGVKTRRDFDRVLQGNQQMNSARIAESRAARPFTDQGALEALKHENDMKEIGARNEGRMGAVNAQQTGANQRQGVSVKEKAREFDAHLSYLYDALRQRERLHAETEARLRQFGEDPRIKIIIAEMNNQRAILTNAASNASNIRRQLIETGGVGGSMVDEGAFNRGVSEGESTQAAAEAAEQKLQQLTEEANRIVGSMPRGPQNTDVTVTQRGGQSSSVPAVQAPGVGGAPPPPAPAPVKKPKPAPAQAAPKGKGRPKEGEVMKSPKNGKSYRFTNGAWVPA